MVHFKLNTFVQRFPIYLNAINVDIHEEDPRHFVSSTAIQRSPSVRRLWLPHLSTLSCTLGRAHKSASCSLIVDYSLLIHNERLLAQGSVWPYYWAFCFFADAFLGDAFGLGAGGGGAGGPWGE